MDIYLDRSTELGQPLPPGEPDFQLPLGQHEFHVASPGQARTQPSTPVYLRAAVYCGATDVLYFVADTQPQRPLYEREEGRLRAIQLNELLHAPVTQLPRLTFDTEQLRTPDGAEPAISWHDARARGLVRRLRADGSWELAPDPKAAPRLLAGVRVDGEQLTLTAASAQGYTQPDLNVSLNELTTDARSAALALMSARHAALADLDALHALQPALRAVSRARKTHGQTDLSGVHLTIERHRQRTRHELESLLQNLRGDAPSMAA